MRTEEVAVFDLHWQRMIDAGVKDDNIKSVLALYWREEANGELVFKYSVNAQNNAIDRNSEEAAWARDVNALIDDARAARVRKDQFEHNFKMIDLQKEANRLFSVYVILVASSLAMAILAVVLSVISLNRGGSP